MTGSVKRGACPTLWRPMETGDGLLARLPAGSWTRADFLALCGAARRQGNGLIEVTARGSLQVRGLTPASAAAFAAAVEPLVAAGSLSVMTNPLAGLDLDEVCDLRPLAAALRQAAEGFASRLAPKVSLLLDGGGALPLDGLAADIKLAAVPDGPQGGAGTLGESGASCRRDPGSARGSAALVRECAFLLFVNSLCLGVVGAREALTTLLRLLALLAESGGRARDLDPARVRQALADLVRPADPPEARPAPQPLARHRLKDGTWALGVALPFGQMEAERLQRLAEAARSLHPAPGRALLLAGLEEARLTEVQGLADALGFITDPADPRRRVAACPGAPACASGQIAARALAPTVAAAAAPLLAEGAVLHLSGCTKGCAHPAPADLTIVGREGRCGLALNATAASEPLATLPPERLAAAIAHLKSLSISSLKEIVPGKHEHA